ncbi:hypothetical protein PFLUV_G00210790 [Perca fluviatilis]|uniref:Cholesterol 24-hydroxylase n=1 Tax=Perca fluviatilis TaxID=8168 RepID=A0A6A5DSD4_PERFL|nr:hypothetical protein PFLUV_G00210790 [Perca fluviatilis]
MAVFHVLLSWTALFLLFLIFISFLGYCLYVKHIHTKYDHIPGPPRDNFLFGHSPTFLRVMRKGDIIHDTFLEWAETYGPVCRINVLHYVALIVTCPKATKEILMSPKYPKDIFYSKIFNLFGQRFLGNGLVTARDHEKWYKQRRIMDPAFSSLYLRGLTDTFNERAEKLMTTLTDVADNMTEASMLHLMNSFTLDVIAKVAFGVDLDLQEDRSIFHKAIETCLKGMFYTARDLLYEYKLKNRPFIKKVREACRLLRTTGAKWINDRKTAMENGDDVPKDILTQIIKTAGKEESITKEDEELMLDNFVTFFIAGQETTANQLAFCIMELGRHRDILEKVKKEVDDVVGMKQEISYDDLGQLVYLSQVLKETLRMYSTVPITSREILEDIVIDGIHIPGGVSCYAGHCYFPFALGPRSCLGQNFAQMEAKVVMAKLLQRFDFTLVPGQTFDIMDTGTLRPKSGVVCSVRHRDQNK